MYMALELAVTPVRCQAGRGSSEAASMAGSSASTPSVGDAELR